MIRLSYLIALLLAAAGPLHAEISGRITTQAGTVPQDARIFVEPGMENALIEGQVSADGSFHIGGEYYGNVGVFAFAPGYGFNGVHIPVREASDTEAVTITLYPASTLSGRIINEKNAPVPNAALTGMAIVSPVKVGIPFFKLAALGIAAPTSNSDGRFVVDLVPDRAEVVLKFTHGSYAQEATAALRAGTQDITVTMHHGVTLSGRVVVRGGNQSVAGAIVTARSAQAPYDTAFSGSDSTGRYSMMLKPGVYMVQAHGAGRISPGMQRVELRGEIPEEQLSLSVSDTGTILGSIHDAKSGGPVVGARIFLEVAGQAAGAVRTAKDGTFRMSAPEGICTLHFEAVDGFRPPDTKAMQVAVPAKEVLELPGLWLAPLSDFSLQVLDDDGETPVAEAFISLLWPRQFGWQRSDAAGKLAVRFSSLPPNNRILGLAEHPTKECMALFSLDGGQGNSGKVVLLPQASVSGRVVNEQGEALAGVAVAGLYADDVSTDAVPLWRCISDKEGKYFWPAVPAGVPQRCVLYTSSEQTKTLRDVNPAPHEQVDLGTARLENFVSVPPDDLALATLPLLCGPTDAHTNGTGTVVLYCTPADAPLYLEAAASVRSQLQTLGLETVLVVNGSFECDQGRVPVYQGTGTRSMTRLFDRHGHGALDCVGLPPISALRRIAMESH
ncbi:MAG: carboxypeptidase regulatory-like domain-containing protein [Candidatus Hydrogenedentes bacterium]|jgi:hypothetical protein|nr:carboxypeptidase regulatory-like domain-containing protein [Candidatus Hydrogenedentota bacterium]